MILKFVWVIALMFGVFGMIEAVMGISASQSAPQQAAGAAMGLAYAAIPYCIARAITEIVRTK